MKYPALQKVLGGRFKEDATMPFILTYRNPKQGGSVEVELSTYVNWTSRLDMKRDKESSDAIKQGLGKILARHEIKSTLMGLTVDRIFQSLDWYIKPLEG